MLRDRTVGICVHLACTRHAIRAFDYNCMVTSWRVCRGYLRVTIRLGPIGGLILSAAAVRSQQRPKKLNMIIILQNKIEI